MNRLLLSVTLAVSFLLILSACESPTSVKVTNGPTFLLGGSGRLAFFRVYGPKPGGKIATPFDESSVLWQVQATDGYFKGAFVRRLRLTYGEVPKGYTQTAPTAGSLMALQPDRIYYVFAESTDAPVAGGFFYMDGNTPVMTQVPGLCENFVTGTVKPVRCGTNEPFVEPSDLKALAQRNRVDEFADR